MLPELSSILRIRRRLGLTQSELARLSRVSQSLVAKVEAGRVDPAYSKAKQVMDTLDHLQRHAEKKARDVMHSPIISVKSTDLLSRAVSKMRRNGFSQLPVEDAFGRIVGSLSERVVVESFERGNLDSKHMVVSEVLDDPFPSVSESTPISAVASLLHDAQAVLVLRKDKPYGIVTKSDLLKAL
ncbi:CBS domain-containing protein [Candidatus Micrarchaeota archaeon]|nr:CBS domain-containing protein [Candidatus Micrarchaeota archaeon]